MTFTGLLPPSCFTLSFKKHVVLSVRVNATQLLSLKHASQHSPALLTLLVEMNPWPTIPLTTVLQLSAPLLVLYCTAVCPSKYKFFRSWPKNDD